MSSVFLSNVDDYLAPSQACVNPLFSETANKKEENGEEKKTPEEPVVQRRRRVVRRRGVGVRSKPASATTTIPSVPLEPQPNQGESSTTATKVNDNFSMADCLACSGCVTTAETVLIQQHSLTTLKEKCQEAASFDPNKQKRQPIICITISPASLADLFRVLEIPSCSEQQTAITTWTRRLASFLHRTCHASVVLDGTLPLQWSLLEAAHEFCHEYKQQQQAENETTAMQVDGNGEMSDLGVTVDNTTPSVALSATQTQHLLPNGQTKLVTHEPGRQQTNPNQQQLPVITSSCPALVCLVEKSVPSAVSHLSSTKSPMAMAGTFFQHLIMLANNNHDYCPLHIAIMPCHDKKLEASRKDLQHPQGKESIPDTDLVITTQEWLTLLQEETAAASQQEEREPSSMSPEEIRDYLETLPLSPIRSSLAEQDISLWNKNTVTLVTGMNGTQTPSASSSSLSLFFPHGSGGYADFVFRYAAQELFGVVVKELPWKPVVSERRQRIKSARAASALNKSVPELHQAVLYRNIQDGTYSCEQQASDSQKAVLQFATAYGLQTIQRILQPFKSKFGVVAQHSQQAQQQASYDYIEAMACPSGCLNGGGQARIVQQYRETPTETRQRVRDNQDVFRQIHQCDTSEPAAKGTLSIYKNPDLCPSGPFGKEAQRMLHTRFHIVPPLQNTMGATAGVAVSDTQW